jgi:hypothetical protein
MQRYKTFALTVLISITLIGVLWHLLNNPSVLSVSAGPLSGDTTQDALVPSTPEDFVLPGTQPETIVDSIRDPESCLLCHRDYEPEPEQAEHEKTWIAWQGSMMAQSGRDPLFYAALDVANAGAANAGEFCLRCHMPRGWLDGRSSSPDASDMTEGDLEGVQCLVCHRMVDIEPGPENPARDAEILADLDLPVSLLGSGQMVIDPLDHRRGPFDIVADLGQDPHSQYDGAKETLQSPYHQESDLCGTCHDINNPMFTWNESSKSYEPNDLGKPGDITQGFPIERTYTEWKLSQYNTPEGVYAPQFGGNKTYVSTCQDCHMRDITGSGGAIFLGSGPRRTDMPLHDLTGGNTWVPQIIPLHPEFGDKFTEGSTRADALEAGIERARAMLASAADLVGTFNDNELTVKVINRSGHKLPSGYIEGRRMWLQVEGYDVDGKMIFSSGAYDKSTGVLEGYHSDPTLKVYESKHGLTTSWANQLGLPAGSSFHFALNNMIVSDNRIPPRGFNYEAFNNGQAAPYTNGEPDPTIYADGQYWDTTTYTLPEGVVRGKVTLLYQVASRDYIEFLRDNNPNPSPNNGDILYDLWTKSGRSEPEIMAVFPFGEQVFMPSIQGR